MSKIVKAWKSCLFSLKELVIEVDKDVTVIQFLKIATYPLNFKSFNNVLQVNWKISVCLLVYGQNFLYKKEGGMDNIDHMPKKWWGIYPQPIRYPCKLASHHHMAFITVSFPYL